MTVILHAKVVAKAEHAEAVKKQLLAIKDDADKKEEGCLVYRVNQVVDDKNTFILFEEYANESAFKHHQAGAAFQKLASNLTEWLAEPLTMTFLQASQL
ncbi:hypothetical protein QFC22_006586 [Naganishia vaughanmartiniae]|uniref:Uncharacterized protein n=1 Tax=Naganishia vaughanmartiniae TaxID=1424756 RepID=A0ACC2WJE4_9TREE|nr:hypothetical protein QFC22_006586 [Naganishia vaughanmartiniae]